MKIHFGQNDSTVKISKICFLMVLMLKTAVFWYEDELGAFEDMTKTSITECGKRVANSKSVKLRGRLHLDLAMQEKHLPNDSESNLRLNLSSPQFRLMSNGSHAKIKIDTAILRVRNVQLLPDTSNELNQTFAHYNAKFPIRREEVKPFTKSVGTRSKFEDQSTSKAYFIGFSTSKMHLSPPPPPGGLGCCPF